MQFYTRQAMCPERVEDREWSVEGGEWRMECGEWRVDS